MTRTAKSILIGGTASHVGKSWMATAICAWLRRRGVRVAPFKAQNMSNNSYPCPGGGEIGRAQVAQAEACGLPPAADMNPILLKPTADEGSQVVVQGQVWRDLTAREYYAHHEFLRTKVRESFDRLARDFEFIVMEGAGSVAELNLRRTDLVNLGLAGQLGAPVLLVADIDRGGVFASICGTFSLLDPEEARLVRSFAVNRFRGDPALFIDGERILEEKTGRRCLGVFPYAHNIHVDEEDGVALDYLHPAPEGGPSIAIIPLPRISNLTDFRLLSWARWVTRPEPVRYDYVVLPGTKNSIADLRWMRGQGLDEWVLEQHARGATLIGVCGGYQMMGEIIEDRLGVESTEAQVRGLGLLPVRTRLEAVKRTETVQARTRGGVRFPAYEIHMGQTERPAGATPFAWIGDAPEGIMADRAIGTYLHGALEQAEVIGEIFGVNIEAGPAKAEHYGRLAQWFEDAADIPLFEELYL